MKHQQQWNTTKLKDQVPTTPGHVSADCDVPSCLSIWQLRLVLLQPSILQSWQTAEEQSLRTLTRSTDEISTKGTIGQKIKFQVEYQYVERKPLTLNP